MSRFALLVALPLLVLATAPAHAQEGPVRHSWILVAAPDAPRAAENSDAAFQSARRPLSRYPLIGFTAGVAVGIGAGMYFHSRIEPGMTDLAGPPAYVITLPLGVATGVLLGVVANWINPPSEE